MPFSFFGLDALLFLLLMPFSLLCLPLIYLGVDLGGKRTGLAVGDDRSGVVSPVGVVETAADDELARAIVKAIQDHAPDAIVVGLPLNMDGTEGDGARRARDFGTRLGALTDRPIHYQDERLTSFAADARLARSGRTHKQKKAIRDALAAAEMLGDFIKKSHKP